MFPQRFYKKNIRMYNLFKVEIVFLFKYSVFFTILYWKARKRESSVNSLGKKYMKLQSKLLCKNKFSKCFCDVFMLFVLRIIIFLIFNNFIFISNFSRLSKRLFFLINGDLSKLDLRQYTNFVWEYISTFLV